MILRRILLAVSTLLLAGALSLASCTEQFEKKIKVDIATAQVADKAVTGTFSRLVTQETVNQLGFASMADLKAMKAGAAYRIVTISVDRLKRFEKGQDVKDLLESTPLVMYLVEVPSGKKQEIDRVRSSVVLDSSSGTWKPVMYGGGDRARAVEAAVSRVAKERGASPFIVQVPALSLRMMGYLRGTKLRFMPLTTNKQYAFDEFASLTADEACMRMRKAAQAYKTLED